MVDFFSNWYASIRNKNRILTKYRIYSLQRYTVRKLANFILPMYLASKGGKERLSKKDTSKFVVSLTTFPARIEKIWMVIESVLRQTVKPNQIVLYLSKEQFAGIGVLPKKLVAQQNRGLQIRFVDGDLRSHKKYFYAFQEYPDANIITIDDDVFYHSKTIETLIAYHNANPKSIIANNTHTLTYESNGKLKTYNSWDAECNNNSNKNVQIGIGGVLYPSNVLYKDLLREDLFMDLAKFADDMWLFAMTRLADRKVIKTDLVPTFLPVIAKHDIKLATKNKGQNMNDIQIQNISKYYLDELGVDPFGLD